MKGMLLLPPSSLYYFLLLFLFSPCVKSVIFAAVLVFAL